MMWVLLEEENDEIERENASKRRRKSTRRQWVANWVQRRASLGVHDQLLNEFRTEDAKLYKNFTRMTTTNYDFLLERVAPLIQRQDTLMRKAITPSERLSVTLRFLATGGFK